MASTARGRSLLVLLWSAGLCMGASALPRGSACFAQGTFLRGEANNDGRLDLADPIFTLNYLFLGGVVPPCLDAADSDDNGQLEITDPIRTLEYLFLTGFPLPRPGPIEKGIDPTADNLTCGGPEAGLALGVTLTEDFDRGLVAGVELVFDSAPGGPPLDLTPAPGGGGSPGSFEVRSGSVDRDPEPELVATLPGNPFLLSNSATLFLPSTGHRTAPVTLRLNLLSARGLLASALATHLPSGEPVLLSPGKKLDLALTIGCRQDLSCLSPGGVNRPPVMARIPDEGATLAAGVELVYTVSAQDPDGDPLTFSIQGIGDLPGAPSFDPTGPTLRWTPPVTDEGLAPVRVRFHVQDGRGGEDSQWLRIAVLSAGKNSPPSYFPEVDRSVFEGDNLTIDLKAVDPDGEPLLQILDGSGLPSNSDAKLDAATGRFTWRPTFEDGREEPWVLRAIAQDFAAVEGAISVRVRVVEVNRPPAVLVQDEVELKAGTTASVPISVFDPDGDPVDVALALCGEPPPFPAEQEQNPLRLVLQPGPNAADGAGNKNWCFRIHVTDQGSPQTASSSREVRLTVTRTNSRPVLVPLDVQQAVEEEPVTFDLRISDPEGDPVSLEVDARLLPGPSSALLAGSTFRWTPPVGSARDVPYQVTFRARDPAGPPVSLPVFISVLPRDRLPPIPPRILSPDILDGLDDLVLTTRTNTIAVDGAADAAKVQLYMAGQLLAEKEADANGDASFDVTVANFGVHTFTARAVDAAGNASPLSEPLRLAIVEGKPRTIEITLKPNLVDGAAGQSYCYSLRMMDRITIPFHIPNYEGPPIVVSFAPAGGAGGSAGEFIQVAKDPPGQTGTIAPVGPGIVELRDYRFAPDGTFGVCIANTKAEAVTFTLDHASIPPIPSAKVAWRPASPAKMIAVLPGQALKPGIPDGDFAKAVSPAQPLRFPSGQPGVMLPHATAGVAFQIQVYVTDRYFNRARKEDLPAEMEIAVRVSGLTSGGLTFDSVSETLLNGSFEASLAGWDRRLTQVLKNAGAIQPVDSHPFEVQPGPAVALAVILPGQTLQSGVQPIGGAPDLQRIVDGTPFGTGSVVANQRFKAEVYAVDAFGNINFSQDHHAVLVDDGVLAPGVSVRSTGNATAGERVVIPGPIDIQAFPIGSIIRIESTNAAVEIAIVISVDPGASMTVDALELNHTSPLLTSLGAIPTGTYQVAQRRAALLSGERAAQSFGTADAGLTVTFNSDPALVASVDLAGRNSGAEIAAAIQSQVRAHAAGDRHRAAFQATFLDPFDRYVLIAGESAAPLTGLETLNATATAATPLKLVDPFVDRFDARPLDSADLTNLGPKLGSIRMQKGIAHLSIDLPPAATSVRRRLVAVSEPQAGFERVFLSEPFDVKSSTLSIESVRLRDTDSNGVIDLATISLNRPAGHTVLPPSEQFMLRFVVPEGPRTSRAIRIEPRPLPNELDLIFLDGPASTSLRLPGLELEVERGTILVPVEGGVPQPPADLGPRRFNADTLNSAGLPVLIDEAPPVLISATPTDTNGDGAPDQLVFVFSEDIKLSAGAPVSVGKPITGPAALQVAAGETLVLRVDGQPAAPGRSIAFPRAIQGAQEIARLFEGLLGLPEPAGFGPNAPSVQFDPFTRRFVVRGGAGAGRSVQVTGGSAAAKLGFDGSQLEVAGSEGLSLDLDDLLIFSSDGGAPLDLSSATIQVAGNTLRIAPNASPVPMDRIYFLYAPLNSTAGASITDNAGNESPVVTNIPPEFVNDPTNSGFIRIRDTDDSPDDGTLDKDPGLVVLDASASLIDPAAPVTFTFLDAGPLPSISVKSPVVEEVHPPANVTGNWTFGSEPLSFHATTPTELRLIVVKLSTTPEPDSPFRFFTGAAGGISRTFQIRIRDLAPTAHAGPSGVVAGEGEEIVLDGRASVDPNDENLAATGTFEWSARKPASGSLISLTGPTPSFTSDELGAHEVALVVRDAAGNASEPVQIHLVVTGTGGRQVPSADAGVDQVVRVGAPITLDGRGSQNPAGGGLLYEWKRLDAEGAVIAAGVFPKTAARPQLVAPSEPGYLTFELTVTDLAGNRRSAPDRVLVTVIDDSGPAPRLPLSAGIQRVQPDPAAGPVRTFDEVVLEAQLPVDPSTVEDFRWKQTMGPTIELKRIGDSLVSFVPALAGTYEFTLQLRDAPAPAEFEPPLHAAPLHRIQVLPPGVAEPKVAFNPAQVSLTGPTINLPCPAVESDPDFTAGCTATWGQFSGPNFILQGEGRRCDSCPSSSTPTPASRYRWNVEVRLATSIDGMEVFGTFTVPLEAAVSLPGETVPLARLTISPGDGSVILDGSASTPAGVEFHFSQVSGPAAVLTPASPDGSRVEFTPHLPGNYEFELTVFDPITGLRSLPARSGTLVRGIATNIAIRSSPAVATAGEPFDLRVEVVDAFGRFDPTVPVTMTAATLVPNLEGAVLLGPTETPTVNGVAVFAGLRIERAGSFRVEASAVLPSVGRVVSVSPPIEVRAAPAVGIEFRAEPPASVQAGDPFSLRLEVVDAFGNLDPTVPATATAATLLPNIEGAVLLGTTETPSVNGVAVFSGLRIERAGTFRVEASTVVPSAGRVTAVSRTIEVRPAAAVRIAIDEEPPLTVAAGEPFSLKADILDAFGNLEPTVPVTMTATVRPNIEGATLSGPTEIMTLNGSAVFTDLKLDRVGQFQLEVSAVLPAVGTVTAATRDVTVQPGAAARLGFRIQPGNSAVGAEIPAPMVELRDSFGNFAPGGPERPIELVWDTNPGGATLQGPTVVITIGGRAVFSGLSADRPAAGNTLRATSPGLQDAVSLPFMIDNNDPPVVQLIPPTGRLDSGCVTIEFKLSDSTSDPAEVELQFQVAAGGPFKPCTQGGSDPGAGFDGTQRLSSSPAGTVHRFLWDTRADIGPTGPAGVAVKVRVAAWDPGFPDLRSESTLDAVTVINETLLDRVAFGAWGAPQRFIVDPIFLQQFGVGLHDLVAASRDAPILRLFRQDPAMRGTFIPGQMFFTGSPAAALAIGDVNQDGRSDVVIADSTASRVQVFLGDGAGIFAPAATAVVGLEPVSLAVRDLNGDGRPDIVTANRASADVSVLLQDDRGGFPGPAARFAAGVEPREIAIGDVDRDGALDLVVADGGSASIQVLRANKTAPGTFQAAQAHTTGDNPVAVVLADVDRDGKLDAVTANLAGEGVTALFGDGAGGFPRRLDLSTGVGSAPMAIAVADLDADGRLDLCVAASGLDAASVFFQDDAAPGTFSPARNYPAGPAPLDIAARDLDLDGRADLVTADSGTGEVSVHLNATARGCGVDFKVPSASATGDGPSAVALGDLNGDGKIDTAVAESLEDRISIYFQTGDGSVAEPVHLATAASPIDLAIGDFDGDARNDVVVACAGADTVQVFRADPGPAGGFLPAVQTPVPAGPVALSLADLNGDSRLDLAVASGTARKVSVFLGNGAGGLAHAPASPISVTGTPVDVDLVDLNGDLTLELLLAQALPNVVQFIQNPATNIPMVQGFELVLDDRRIRGFESGRFAQKFTDLGIAFRDSNRMAIYLGKGDGTFAPAPVPEVDVGSRPRSAAVGDLDRDGALDIAVACEGSNDLRLLHGRGDGTFDLVRTIPCGSGPVDLALGDCDGDDILDVTVVHDGSKSLWVLEGDGMGGFETAPDFGTGDEPAAPVVADLDADGRLDVVLAVATLNEVQVHRGLGMRSFAPPVRIAVAGGPAHVTLLDANRDAFLDLAVACESADRVALLLGDGAGGFGAPIVIPAADGPRCTAASDFDRDGKIDLAVACAGAGTVEVRHGNGDGGFGPAQAYPAGLQPVWVAAEDMNRDGFSDLVVADGGGSAVLVLLNDRTGAFLPARQSPFGAPLQALAIGDLNTDKAFDVAVLTDSGYRIAFGDGIGGLIPASGAPITQCRFIGIVDTDVDGNPDVVVASPRTVSIARGNGMGGFDPPGQHGAPFILTGVGPVPVVVGGEKRILLPDGRSAGGCCVARFQHLGGPAVQRAAAAATVFLPLLLLACLRGRLRRREAAGRT